MKSIQNQYVFPSLINKSFSRSTYASHVKPLKFFGCKISTEPVRKSLSNYFCDTSNLINASTFLVQSDDNSYDSSLCDFKKGSLFPFLICNYFELNTCLHLIVRWWCFFFVPCRISFESLILMTIIILPNHNRFDILHSKSQKFVMRVNGHKFFHIHILHYVIR